MTRTSDNHDDEVVHGAYGTGDPPAADAGFKSDDEKRRYVEALETLPLLTRTVFMLNRLDDLSYDDIGWRCGISTDEVMVRMADGLFAIGQYLRGRATVAARARRALLPWRDAWAAARKRESDRRLLPWLSPDKTPGIRKPLEWLVWIFEKTMR